MANLDAMLGFCAKAGKLVIGSEACRKAISGGKAKLMLLSPTASGNTRKEFEAICQRANVRLLGQHDFTCLIGRPACKVAAVMETGFAKSIEKAYDSVYPLNI